MQTGKAKKHTAKQKKKQSMMQQLKQKSPQMSGQSGAGQTTVQKRQKLSNSHSGDSSGKLLFGDSVLCSQFLRGYTQIDLLKDVEPEDIEDVTERFVHMFTEERNSDVIKRVHLKSLGTSCYIISLFEHKSTVDYNVVMQLLRYMVFIWENYEKEMERKNPGISKTKGFQYPPILPIIYYTGGADWTAATTLEERIRLSDILKEYIPNFTCILVQVKDYSNVELMAKRDEMSIIMMINKLQQTADFIKWKEDVGVEYLNDITEGTPEYLLKIMAQMVEILLENINVPREEAVYVAENIKERNMAGLFDHFEKIDIQAARREIAQEKATAREEGLAEGLAEGREVGRAEGREVGRAEGREVGRAEGHEAGLAEGHEAGLAEGFMESLIMILRELGELPAELEKKITSETDRDVLTMWIQTAARAGSITEFREKTGL